MYGLICDHEAGNQEHDAEVLRWQYTSLETLFEIASLEDMTSG
jgi:hypothetical protein